MKKLPELLSECSDVCVEGTPPKLSLIEEVVYSGCDLCIIRSAIDKLSLPTMSLTFRDGRYGEFVAIEEYVIEITEETAQLLPIDELDSRLEDLKEFGLLSNEDERSIKAWLKSFSRHD